MARLFRERLGASYLTERLARGAFWSLSSALLLRGMTLATSIMMARFLGKAGFGQLGILQSTVVTSGVFAGFGMSLTASKYVAEFREKDPVRTGKIISFCLWVSVVGGAIVSLVLALFAPWLAARIFAAPELAGPLRVSALVIFLGNVNNTQSGVLAGFEAFKTIARVNILVSVLSFPIMIIGAYYFGLPGVVWAFAASMALNCLVNHRAMTEASRSAGIAIGSSGCFQDTRLLWKFSVPAIIGGLFVDPVNWICGALLVNQPHGFAEMGAYNAAYQWRQAIQYFPMTLSTIALPILSNLYGKEDKTEYKHLLRSNLMLNSVVAVIAVIAVSFASRMIMQSYGGEFAANSMVLVLLACSAGLVSISFVIGSAILSSGKAWHGFAFNALWAVLMLMCAYTLIPGYGSKGLALANLIAYIVLVAAQLLYLRKVA